MEALIFDVDGTLWDSTEEVAFAWNQALEKWPGIKKRLTAQILMPEFGKTMEDIMQSLFPELSPEDQTLLAEEMYIQENAYVKSAPCKIYDGVLEWIPKFSEKYRLFIVSNCQRGYIEAFLENTGLGEYITDHVCSGDTGCQKAENIKLVMKRNGIRDAVYIGDTQRDADASREAGIPFIYASYGFGQVDASDGRIESFRELERWLNRKIRMED